MKQRTVLSMIGEQRGQAALWLLLSAGIGFFAPLKSFILQWIIDSKTVEHALMCLLAGVAITVASHGFELSCRSAFTKLACGAMDSIRRRVMKGVLARSMEQAQREEDAAYLSALTTDMRTLYDECFMPLFNIVFWGAILLCAIGMYLFVSPALLLIVAVMSVPPLILPRLSGLAAYIASLPEGLDTRIAENGKNLSGGQAQRIGIARAAIRGYRVILADEITASLDEATSQQVMENLLNMDATVMAITHDTQGEFMKRFDSVYRIEDGKVKRQARRASDFARI